jgi:TonB family protein
MSRKSLAIVVVAGLLVGGAVWFRMAPEPSAPHDYLKRGGKAPRVLSKKDAEYSSEAKRVHMNASVGIKAVVGEDGKLRDISVQRGAGFGLDEKAVEAAGLWRFSPAEYQGRPLAVPISFAIPFRLPDLGVPTASLKLKLPPHAIRPVLEEGNLEHLELPSEFLQVSFSISRNGQVEQIQGADAPISERLSHWRFQPAILAGSPIPIDATLNLYPAK